MDRRRKLGFLDSFYVKASFEDLTSDDDEGFDFDTEHVDRQRGCSHPMIPIPQWLRMSVT